MASRHETKKSVMSSMPESRGSQVQKVPHAALAHTAPEIIVNAAKSSPVSHADMGTRGGHFLEHEMPIQPATQRMKKA